MVFKPFFWQFFKRFWDKKGDDDDGLVVGETTVLLWFGFEAMAVLGQNIGQTKRLGLSNAFDASNKHVVFVKLTDSSLEALQNYIRKQGNHSSANNKVGKKRPEKKK